MAWLFQPLLPGAAELQAGVVVGNQGKVKVWNGTQWVIKPVKVWTGAAWVEKPAKYYNGITWVTTNPV